MAAKGKQSFVLYHDIRQPLELLTDAERGQLFLAILDYSEKETLPNFTGAQQMAFAFIKTSLDRDAAAWEDKREKRRAAGSEGGKQRAANLANASVACGVEANQANQAVPVPVPAPVPVPGIKKRADKPPRAPRFIPPTVEEVEKYCTESGKNVDAEAFVNFYTSKGWRVGKELMRDWKAAVCTWVNREHAQQRGKGWGFDDFRRNDRSSADLQG